MVFVFSPRHYSNRTHSFSVFHVYPVYRISFLATALLIFATIATPALADNKRSVDLEWGAVPDATGYEVRLIQ